MLAVEQLSRSSSEVRKEWSSTIDATVRLRPQFIQRTHDNITMLNTVMLAELLGNCKLHASLYQEPDGSITASVDEIDVIENGATMDECLDNLLMALKEYARDYYEEFDYWSAAPNRRAHLPYVIKLLTTSDEILRRDIICHAGKN
ncbi:MAG: hypothetical protein J5906_10440 [Acidaminococcaceae bacterium]|nr:hypothetical protein [Acidaminococcaceae bacterium]